MRRCEELAVHTGPSGNGRAGLPAGRPRRSVDVPAAERAVADLLVALGADPSSEHLRQTPREVAALYAELLAAEPFDLASFAFDGSYDELVVARDVSVRSLCRRHLLPFTGRAHVGYLPDGSVLGLSELARVVELLARDLQLQQRLTCQVADWLDEHLRPRGVGVVMEAEGCCLARSGLPAGRTITVTSALRGAVRDDVHTRREFFSMIAAGQRDRGRTASRSVGERRPGATNGRSHV